MTSHNAERPTLPIVKAQGMRKNGPFHDFFCPVEGDLDGLSGESGDVGVLIVVGEVGGLPRDPSGGSRGVGLYMVGRGKSTVRIEALSSSEMPASVLRSVYALTTELTRVIEDEDRRMVSVSEPELIVDIVRREAMLDARSEPDVDDPAFPMSCLCAPQ